MCNLFSYSYKPQYLGQHLQDCARKTSDKRRSKLEQPSDNHEAKKSSCSSGL